MFWILFLFQTMGIYVGAGCGLDVGRSYGISAVGEMDAEVGGCCCCRWMLRRPTIDRTSTRMGVSEADRAKTFWLLWNTIFML